MTTQVQSAIAIGPISKMFAVLIPTIASEQTMKLAANTRFTHEWEKALAEWGTDEDSKSAAAEELMESGLLQPFPFSLQTEFEIDQKREQLGFDASMSADFLQMVKNVYEDVLINAGSEANKLCMQLQIDAQAASTHIQEAVAPAEEAPIADNIDSEGPAHTEPVADMEGGAEEATFSTTAETETTTAEPVLNTADWDKLLADQLVQDTDSLATSDTTSAETTGAETTNVLDVTSGSGQETANQNANTDALSIDTTPAVADNAGLIDDYQNALLEIFKSPITANTIGEVELELQDSQTHDFEAKIMALGGEPCVELYLAVNARINALTEKLNTLKEAAEWEKELAAEEAARLEKMAAMEALKAEESKTPTEETLELKQPYEIAGFASHQAWIASFDKEKKKETKVVALHPEKEEATVELNVGGKYSGNKTAGNRPTQAKDMTDKQAAMAAKALYRNTKRSTNLKGMNNALRTAFSASPYEAASLGTCKVGEVISIFPNTLLPNQAVKMNVGEGKKEKRTAVGVGTAFFNKDAVAYGFGLHWRNLPTKVNAETKAVEAAFVWPIIDVTFNFQRKGRDGQGGIEWYKDTASIPVPMILEGSFGHAEQAKSGKRPTAVIKSSNPKCYRPTLLPATTNNLIKMTSLGYTYLGTTEVPRGREFAHSGITGMKLHVFLPKNPKAMLLSNLIEDNTLANMNDFSK